MGRPALEKGAVPLPSLFPLSPHTPLLPYSHPTLEKRKETSRDIGLDKHSEMTAMALLGKS